MPLNFLYCCFLQNGRLCPSCKISRPAGCSSGTAARSAAAWYDPHPPGLVVMSIASNEVAQLASQLHIPWPVPSCYSQKAAASNQFALAASTCPAPNLADWLACTKEHQPSCNAQMSTSNSLPQQVDVPFAQFATGCNDQMTAAPGCASVSPSVPTLF